MSPRWQTSAAAAALAACALLAAACGRSAGTGSTGSSGQVSPTKGLVTSIPAGSQTGALGYLGRIPAGEFA